MRSQQNNKPQPAKVISKRPSSRGRTPIGDPNPVDIHIGKRIRLRRNLLNLSQERLAQMLGITFQQIQKYERGFNRISGSHLWDISQMLGVPIDYFYEDMTEETAGQSPRMFILSQLNPRLQEEPAILPTDPMNRKEVIELVTNWLKIKNRKTAKLLKELVQNCARYAAFEEEK